MAAAAAPSSAADTGPAGVDADSAMDEATFPWYGSRFASVRLMRISTHGQPKPRSASIPRCRSGHWEASGAGTGTCVIDQSYTARAQNTMRSSHPSRARICAMWLKCLDCQNAPDAGPSCRCSAPPRHVRSSAGGAGIPLIELEPTDRPQPPNQSLASVVAPNSARAEMSGCLRDSASFSCALPLLGTVAGYTISWSTEASTRAHILCLSLRTWVGCYSFSATTGTCLTRGWRTSML